MCGVHSTFHRQALIALTQYGQSVLPWPFLTPITGCWVCRKRDDMTVLAWNIAHMDLWQRGLCPYKLQHVSVARAIAVGLYPRRVRNTSRLSGVSQEDTLTSFRCGWCT